MERPAQLVTAKRTWSYTPHILLQGKSTTSESGGEAVKGACFRRRSALPLHGRQTGNEQVTMPKKKWLIALTCLGFFLRGQIAKHP